MIHANLLARLARLTTRVPVVVSTAHSIDEGGRAREVAYRLTDHLSDHTTNVSRAAVERYVAVRAAPERKISFVANGIDLDRFRHRPETRSRLRGSLGLGDDFVWFAAGRLDAAKDYPTMFDAFAQTLSTGPPARLLIAGDGPDEPTLRRNLAERGLSDRISLLGRRADVADLMSAADGYLMSSAWEGLPMVLLEAAASSLPIVATDVGGNREVAIDGHNALLAPPGDPEALATQMTRLMTLPGPQRRVMGSAGRETVAKTYDIEAVLDRWSALYRALLERRGVPL